MSKSRTLLVASILAPLVFAVGLVAAMAVPSGAAEKCIAYDVSYTNGAEDVGEFCDGNTVTRDDVPDLNAVELHISCSDDLSDPDKSDLGGLTAAEWSIVKHDGKTCSDVDPSGDGKCIAYDVSYTNGARDEGVQCDGKTVTRDDVPDLNAVELHISCSD
ncbi:MAG: hypothetical protein OSA99_19690, partial [Acidimicrobiales bacterium]|nr:hypothetical protein [Acidimicrobiales bacterium]